LPGLLDLLLAYGRDGQGRPEPLTRVCARTSWQVFLPNQDSWLPALNGTRMSLDGILNLWSCVIPGVLRLDQAKVTGQVCLRGARIGMAVVT